MKRPGVRKLVSRPYIIFYRARVEENCVDILRYWHAAQGDPVYALYLELQESQCPRDGRWLRRRILWSSLLVEKSCACGYRTGFSFAPGSGRTTSTQRTSATAEEGWRGGGGGESGGGGADRQY